MRSFVLALSIALLAACASKPGSGTDGGAEGSTTATTSGDGGTAAAPQAKGAGCGVESSTQQTLCTQMSICPQLVIDPDVFPNCGFRLHGTAIDVECACSGYLCPLGAPATCAQAAQLLQNQTEFSICAQVNEGRCSGGGPASANPAVTNPCDKSCASECGGSPQCIKDCGC